ncbi:hypothetical protein LWC35_22470 [Pseudonocardia kujensis]|uniref:MaoC/PaaZ C-terminal domain-containing protein n=1 Tax=Pseudonocardia kujensis TaxID=1128675 RepID=UPI001E2EE0EF|nr:MaoC/PaaZ C-terminal domain-containing protein [Pseudonocardia kujensis]MCE0765647.1 hypothetical protein [Pseudonocardia kujensis]
MGSSTTEASREAAASGERAEAPYFEDFEVGRVYTGPARTFSAAVVAAFAEVSGDEAALHTERGPSADGRPLVHGPLGLAGFFGWHHDRGLSVNVEAAFDTHWDFVAPIHVGDSVTYEMTVTRTRRTSALRNGVVGRHVVVRNQHGEIVQVGRTAALVTAREVVDDRAARLGRAFPSTQWAQALAARLADSAAFTRATGTWDGTIGLRFGGDLVVFRVYKGRVLEAGTRTPDGPTFVVSAPDVVWAGLLTGPQNDFTKRTMRDEFEVEGSAYEYLRLTSAIVALVEEARAFARAEGTR